VLGFLNGEVLKLLVGKGRFAESDMAWKNGMDDWVEVGSLRGISVKSKKDEVVAPVAAKTSGSMSTISDASIYETAQMVPKVKSEDKQDYEGMGRFAYFVMPMIITALWVAGFHFFKSQHAELTKSMPLVANLGIPIAFAISLMLPTFSRFKNLGMSGWNFLWLIVPVVNLWVSYRLYVCPAGYSNHKKLDIPGKMLVTLCVLGFALSITAGVLVGPKVYTEALDVAQKKIEEQKLKIR